MHWQQRLLVHAGVLGIVLGCTMTAYAQEDYQQEIARVAAQAGIDPMDLMGAVNTTGYDPQTYLCLVGEGTCPKSPALGAVWQADCIISKESGGRDVPNARGSGAWGPGQYFPSTWAAHTALYRAATGYGGSLSLHVYADVERVMAWVLANVKGARSNWTVRGC